MTFHHALLRQGGRTLAYSLLYEPWIEVQSADGSARSAIGLQELLLNAQNFGRIEASSPLVTVAIYRLCLAILYRALGGPESIEQAAEWFQNGFPTATLEDYLQTHAEHFDLFHPTQPFMQDWRLPPTSHDYHWSLIASEHGSYNTDTLYGLKTRIKDTIGKDEREQAAAKILGSATPQESVQHLLQHLTFALGGRSTGTNEPQADSPAASAALVLAEGSNLHKTLCLNLIPYGADANNDLAPWEWMEQQPEARFKGKHAIRGYADRYTWLARGVRLQPDEMGQVTWLAYGGGIQPVKEAQGQYLEPMAAYQTDSEGGLRPLRFDPDRLFWRDFTALLPGGNLAPMTISHAANVLREVRRQESQPTLSRRERVRQSERDYQQALPISVYGLSRKQQKIELYRQEHFTLPETVVTDPKLYTNAVKVALEDAEAGAMALRRSLRLMCWLIVTTEADRSKEGRTPEDIAEYLAALPDDESATAYKGKEVAKKVARLYRQLPSHSVYWSLLDPSFRQFLMQAQEPEAERDWYQSIVRAAKQGWKLALAGLGDDAAALKADAMAEILFRRLLGPLEQKARKEVET